jgi:hypothetical protein
MMDACKKKSEEWVCIGRYKGKANQKLENI